MPDKSYKILVITEVFYPEEFLINDLVFKWVQRGFKIEVLTKTPSYPFGKTYKGYKNKIYQINKENGIKVHRIKIIKGYNKSVIRKVLNYITNALLASIVALRVGKRFDAVFIYQTGPLTFALPGVLVNKFYKNRTVIWTQDLWPDAVFSYGFKKTKFNEKLLNAFVKFIYKNIDVVMVTSRSFTVSLKKIIGKEKELVYVPQWSLVKKENVKDFESENIWPSKKFHFTFAGNVGKVQNLDNVIEGFGKVSEKYPEKIQLNIIGEGSHLIDLKNKVNTNNIKNVVFHGRKPVNMMTSFFKKSNVLVISLADDPLFNKYIPAKFQSYLTSEKPILAIMNGEVKDLVIKNNLGWVSDPGNINEISKVIEKIYLDRVKIRNQKINNAKKLLAKEFNREKIIENITNYLVDKNEK